MKPKPSGYIPAVESAKPGYLQRRFAKIRAEQKAARDAEAAKPRAVVRTIKAK